MQNTKDSKKTRMLTVKFSPQTLEDFAITAKLRGTTMSAMVSQFVLKAIQEEKFIQPEKFPDFVGPALNTLDQDEMLQVVYRILAMGPKDVEVLRKAIQIVEMSQNQESR